MRARSEPHCPRCQQRRIESSAAHGSLTCRARGGRGKTLATIAGAVGGGYAGNRIGQGGQNTVYVIHIRMADGNTQRVQVQDAQGIRDGDIVRVDSKGNISVVAQR